MLRGPHGLRDRQENHKSQHHYVRYSLPPKPSSLCVHICAPDSYIFVSMPTHAAAISLLVRQIDSSSFLGGGLPCSGMLCLCRYAAAWRVPTVAALIAARRAGTAHNTSELEHSLRRTVAVLNRGISARGCSAVCWGNCSRVRGRGRWC
jgi:hypothetical protein